MLINMFRLASATRRATRFTKGLLARHPQQAVAAPFLVVLIGISTLLAGPAPGAPVRDGGAGLAYDFLIANVCLDKAGRTLVGVSPIDGDPRCVAQRDLRIGERLPYHTRQIFNGAGDVKGSDSFPIRSGRLGPLAVHIYDYAGFEPGRTPGYYSVEQGVGGGTIARVSQNTASFIGTQLGPQSLRLFVGAGCQPNGPVTADALQDAWVLAPLGKIAGLVIPPTAASLGQVLIGGVESLPSRMTTSTEARCPPQLPQSTTVWSIRPVVYRAVYKAGPRKGQHVVLWTLVVEHFGRDPSHLNDALSIERAYFTRELGWTRWEAWKSNERDPGDGRMDDAHARVISRNNCPTPSSPASTSFRLPAAPLDAAGRPRTDMIITGCVEATDIALPRDTRGDPPPTGPGTWLYSVFNTPIGAFFRPD